MQQTTPSPAPYKTHMSFVPGDLHDTCIIVRHHGGRWALRIPGWARDLRGENAVGQGRDGTQTQRHTGRQRHRRTGRQTRRHTEGQAQRVTDRQRDRERQRDRNTYIDTDIQTVI